MSHSATSHGPASHGLVRRMFAGTPGRVFGLLCLMYFIMYIDRVNISVAAPLIRNELHLSNTELGLALSAFGWCYAVFQVPVGWLGDKLGSRRMLSVSGILWGAGTLLTGFGSGLAALCSPPASWSASARPAPSPTPPAP